MPARRTFATTGQYESGGEESEARGLPFVSTTCEDWYGFGDGRCPNRYKETGDLEADIKSLEKWIGFYREGSWWHKENSDELYRKKAELKVISIDDQQGQRLLQVDKIINTLEQKLAELERTLAGFHPQHYIRQSIEAEIKQIKEKIIQKKTRN